MSNEQGQPSWPTPQPIETAPINGSWFLGYDVRWGWVNVCFNGVRSVFVDGEGDRVVLTHWLPLPPDPQ